METIEIKYQRTKSEIFWRMMRQFFLRQRFAFAFLLLILISLFNLRFSDHGRGFGVAGFWFSLLVIVFFTYFSLKRADSLSKKPVDMRVGDVGLSYLNPNGVKMEIGWNAFTGWSETKYDFFLFVRDKEAPLTIPKRAFSVEQVAVFLKYLSKVPKSSRLSVGVSANILVC